MLTSLEDWVTPYATLIAGEIDAQREYRHAVFPGFHASRKNRWAPAHASSKLTAT